MPDHSRAARHPSRPTATELLGTPGALLSRTHLRELGLERRAVDAVFRALPVVALPGYSRPIVRAEDYLPVARREHLRGRSRPAGNAALRVIDVAQAPTSEPTGPGGNSGDVSPSGGTEERCRP